MCNYTPQSFINSLIMLIKRHNSSGSSRVVVSPVVLLLRKSRLITVTPEHVFCARGAKRQWGGPRRPRGRLDGGLVGREASGIVLGVCSIRTKTDHHSQHRSEQDGPSRGTQGQRWDLPVALSPPLSPPSLHFLISCMGFRTSASMAPVRV